MNVTLLCPTLNEIRGVTEILPQIPDGLVQQILILDGGSKDGTVELARERGYDVVIQEKPGIRLAYRQALPFVRGDIVVTFSPDGNSRVEELPALIEKMKEGYDMVIASRYLGDAKSEDDTALTALGNFLFTKWISCFGYRYTDAMVMYRAYKRDLPERLALTTMRSELWEKHVGRYVSWEPQMSIRCAKAKLKIGEIPSPEPLRLDEREGPRLWLPTSRIRHFRTGLASFMQLLEEIFVWNGPLSLRKGS